MALTYNFDKKAIIETLKSAGRFVWFGLLGVIVLALGTLVVSPQIATATIDFVIYGQTITISVGAIIVGVIGVLIKGIDTYIHNNKKIDSNGLAPSFLQK